jgi:hypothetical protein
MWSILSMTAEEIHGLVIAVTSLQPSGDRSFYPHVIGTKIRCEISHDDETVYNQLLGAAMMSQVNDINEEE